MLNFEIENGAGWLPEHTFDNCFTLTADKDFILYIGKSPEDAVRLQNQPFKAGERVPLGLKNTKYVKITTSHAKHSNQPLTVSVYDGQTPDQ
jgi:hypothetical protein